MSNAKFQLFCTLSDGLQDICISLLSMIANQAVQSYTQTPFTVIFVHRHLNNASYNKCHFLIGMPYLTISANNELQHPFWSVSQKNPAKVVP